MRKLLAILCVVVFSLLVGCSATSQAYRDPVTQQERMALAIEAKGAQVIQQGKKLQLILPTDNFFQTPTTHLKADQVSTMKLIANYLNDYCQQFNQKVTIVVSGHTDMVYDRQTQMKLSKRYAEVVASFLQDEGVSRKQLQVQGQGSSQNIANPKTMHGSGYNRRVTIQIN